MKKIAILILAFLVLAGCSSKSSTPEVSRPKTEEQSKPEELNSSQNLIRAKECFERINSNLNLGDFSTASGYVKKCYDHIQAIGKNDLEYREAQKLYKEVGKRVEQYYKEKEILKGNIRKTYAKDLEHEMLTKGYDYQISVGGKNNEILFIKYALIGRVWCTQFINSPLEGKLSGMGFEKIVMNNGYDYKITWNLVKQKWEY